MNYKKNIVQQHENNASLTEEETDVPTMVESTKKTTNATITSNSKERKGWFHSLTRRKKTQTQSTFYPNSGTQITTSPTTASTIQTDEASNFLSTATCLQSNNNNEPLVRTCIATNEDPSLGDVPSCSSSNNSTRKRKDEKSAFQRFRKKMGLRLPSFRLNKQSLSSSTDEGATTDASSEFLTRSPIHEPLHFNFKCSSASDICANSADDADMIPFTNDFKRFIKKKWLEREDGPNRVMYEASSEMLNQVWYWGEISRRDAQKQLTDKPTGSFLVRDSETFGCQFTLSFRIINVTLHYRLEYRNDYWHFEELQYESIVEMIEDILYRCTNNNFLCFVKVPNEMQPPFPVILKYPLSRYLNMPKLQDLCRRAIQRSTKPEDIAKMSIPPGLQEYLAETRELVF